MKIASGRFKGKNLIVPKSGVIPTSEMVRQAIINICKPLLREASILDLYAGTGAVGIEALSNGAGFCCFVEFAGKIYKTLKDNLEAIVPEPESYRTIRHNAAELNRELFMGMPLPFYVVFADPFYKDTPLHFDRLYDFLFDNEFPILAPGGVFIIEHHSKMDFSRYDYYTRTKKYGETSLSVFEKPEETS